ncbi:MAG: efflux RND transporter periplasmic adaptor subunit [Maricaulaceae bacterium]
MAVGRFIFLGVVSTIAAGMAIAVALRGDSDPDGGRFGGGGFPAAPVRAATIETREFADVGEAFGTARALESVTITSTETDVIARLGFDSGDAVASGQVLVELADAEEAADLAEVNANLAEAEAEFKRVKDLTDRGVAPRQQLEQAEAAMRRAQARVRALRARNSDRVIRAPFAGVVGLRFASPGMLVRPGDEIATLDDVSSILVDFTVPEVYLGALRVGQPLEMRTAAYEDAAFDASIAHIDSRVDPITRTVTVRATAPNPEGRLRPGMLMLVDMTRAQRESAAAPEIAVLREGSSAFVYVIVEGEGGLTAQRRGVVPGARRSGFLEIIDGIAPGERIVAEGVNRIRPGMAVKVVGGSRDAEDRNAAEAAPAIAAASQDRAP